MPEEPTPRIARIAVDVPLSHLDRPFDYAVLPSQDAEAVPGARVRVRFAGRLRDGVILERPEASEHEGALTAIHKIISSEPVLTAEVATLIRAVADHYAGMFVDVLRLAVPPRHAATEQAQRAMPAALPDDPPVGPLSGYPTGPQYLTALRNGGRPRGYWQVTPSAAPGADWAAGLAEAARACADGGRGAVIVVPDQRDLQLLRAACEAVLGKAGFAVLSADTGPAARYRAFLAALRGDVKVVIGNRAAAYAPVADLGLVALWDDGDDLLVEQRAPYPHTRDVLALRATQTRAAVLFAGYSRTAEVQVWIDRGWLVPLAQERQAVRHAAPRVRVTADSDHALERDPLARAARLPHEVFALMRSALPQGPVLVQVPRGGYLVALVCQSCREPAHCRFCSGPVRAASGGGLSCGWCGRPQPEWECVICGSPRVRAPIVGAERTAEELGKAFPQTTVVRSVGGQVLDRVRDAPAIVVATPGAEPPAEHGYAAAVLLDTQQLLLRSALRAGEEALRRWLSVVALVRGGDDGGSVIAVGESSGRALQALVRVDPAGFAVRELAERIDAGLPPAAAVLVIDGASAALAEFVELARLPDGTDLLGPVPLPGATLDDQPVLRLTARSPRPHRAELARAAKEVAAIRSARKADGALRMIMDPIDL